MPDMVRFFRSAERRATELEIAAVLFESVLGRRATEADLKAAAPGLSTPGGLRAQVSAMVNSPEFAIMRLPHLLASAAKDYQGEKIFFLHVPKTAGTSLRLAFIEAMGIPALDRYNRVGKWDGYSDEFLRMWPLLVGHTNVYNFPKGTHRGVTVFREPRARTLSLFRQQTRASFSPLDHLEPKRLRQSNSKPQDYSSNFSGWLEYTRHPLDLLTWHVEVDPGRELAPGDEVGVSRTKQAQELEKHGAASIQKALVLGLQRIQVAEWQHNKEGMDTLLERALGRLVANSIPRANQVLPEQAEKLIQLSTDDHAQMTEIASRSQIVFDIAVEQGLIAPLSKDEADRQFEIAANRLGFKL